MSDSNSSSALFQRSRERSASLVIQAGIFTTVITLLGVYLLDRFSDDFHVMGWYANYILPVGALLVGAAASSGYGIASWFTGVKISRSLLWIVFALQFFAYFAAQYIEFKGLHLVHSQSQKAVGFFEYFDWQARSFAWQEHNGSAGEPLGMWGYFFRGLEILGFAAGGLIAPAILRKAPYCEACQLYMRRNQIALIPASIAFKKIKKKEIEKQAEHNEAQKEALERGKTTWNQLADFARTNKYSEFNPLLAELKPHRKAAAKLPIRIGVHIVNCQRCRSGFLSSMLVIGQGNRIETRTMENVVLNPDFVMQLRSDLAKSK